VYAVSHKMTLLYDEHVTILIIFGRHVVKKVSSQMVLYFSISAN